MNDAIVAWCGSRSDGLGWLSERCAAIESLKFAESLSVEALDELCSQHPRRLILSVENRLCYPLDEVHYLQRVWPEVPFAVAMGSWFDGSRRTGVGSTAHLSMPWFRWWDGWYPWLTGSDSGLLDAWPHMRLQVSESCQPSPSFGHVVCNCRQTAAGWMASLSSQGAGAMTFTFGEYCTRLAIHNPDIATDANWANPDWVLWDDTCLNSFCGASAMAETSEWIARVRQVFPTAAILAAIQSPRCIDWRKWVASGANELIAKPTCSVPLRAMLARNAAFV